MTFEFFLFIEHEHLRNHMKMNTVSSNLLRNKKFLKKIPSQDTFRNGQNFNIFTSIKVCSFLYYYLSCRMKTNPEFCYEEYKDFNILKM